MPVIDVPTVHAVTNDEILADSRFVPRAAGLLRAHGRRVAVHIRGHSTPARRLLALTRDLVREAPDGAWIVVNDRADVALAAPAAALHLRERSLDLDEVRQIAPSLVVGVSVHSQLAASAAAARRSAWIFAGPVFETASHPGRPGRGISFVAEVAATHPRTLAIGGVRPEHVGPLRAAGAWGVAVISGVWHSPDPAEAAARYL